MRILSPSDFKKDFKAHLRLVANRSAVLVIHRRKRGKDVVVISLEEYNALNETRYLLSNPANAQRLMESIEQHRSSRLGKKSLSQKPEVRDGQRLLSSPKGNRVDASRQVPVPG